MTEHRAFYYLMIGTAAAALFCSCSASDSVEAAVDRYVLALAEQDSDAYATAVGHREVENFAVEQGCLDWTTAQWSVTSDPEVTISAAVTITDADAARITRYASYDEGSWYVASQPDCEATPR